MGTKENQIITVWGSPGSGKTVTSMKLAKEMVLQKKNVLLVFADLVCPALPTVVAFKNKMDQSIGNVLSAPFITQEIILKNCILFDGISGLSAIGYKRGDNIFTYSEYDKERAIDFFILLRSIADYVIVDCSSSLAEDILSTVALEVADQVIRLGSCDLKSVSYFSSYLPLIEDKKFSTNRHMRVLSNVKPRQEFAEYAGLMGGVKYTIPYLSEVDEQYFSLNLMGDLSGKKTKGYKEILKSMAMELMKGSAKEGE